MTTKQEYVSTSLEALAKGQLPPSDLRQFASEALMVLSALDQALNVMSQAMDYEAKPGWRQRVDRFHEWLKKPEGIHPYHTKEHQS